MSVVIDILLNEKISYAILKEIYDVPSNIVNQKNYKKDLDIVVNCSKNEIIDKFINHDNLLHIEKNSFFDKINNIRVDIYFKTLNVGYYHYLKIDQKSYGQNKIQDIEYLIYIILDPILKFSFYQNRHQYILNKYFNNFENNDLKIKLSNIIGKLLANKLLDKLRIGDFYISNSFIKICKFRMLFINDNFALMLRNRFFNATKI